MRELIGIGRAATQLGLRVDTLRKRLLYDSDVPDTAQRAPNGARLCSPDDIRRLRMALKK